jgi:SAM-dependent methyltransferase
MLGFDPDWLALREPYDHAARNPGLAARFAASLGDAPAIIDLGCGTGSNLRYLAPRLGRDQSWICIDHDRLLLRASIDRIRAWATASGWSLEPAPGGIAVVAPEFSVRARLRAHDLARGLPADVPAGAGVSASALLDLTSAAWLDAFAGRCRRRALLLAISFDGRLDFSPADEGDDEVRQSFLRHQRTDKGFGPALGPDAAAYLADRLRKLGHEVELASSDWHLRSGADGPLLTAKLDGLVSAAGVMEDPTVPARWAALRRTQLKAGELGLEVGHLDLLALPR